MGGKIIIVGEPSDKLLQFALQQHFEVVICDSVEEAEKLDDSLVYTDPILKTLEFEKFQVDDLKADYFFQPKRPTKADRRNWRKYVK